MARDCSVKFSGKITIGQCLASNFWRVCSKHNNFLPLPFSRMSGVPPRPGGITLSSTYDDIYTFLDKFAGPEVGRRIADAVGNGAGFQRFSDQQLLDLGVPPAILSRLRAKIPFQSMPPTSPVQLSTTPLQSSPQSQTSAQGGHTPQRSPPPFSPKISSGFQSSPTGTVPSTPVVNGGSGNSSGGPQSSPTFRSVPYTDADVQDWSKEQIKHWAMNVCGTSEADAVKLSELMSGAEVLTATLATLKSLTADAKAKVLPCVKAKTWGERREVVQPTVTDTSDGVSVAVLSRADVCERLLPSNRTPTNFELNTLLAMCKSAHNANTNSTREKPTSSALSTIPTAIVTTDVLLGPYRAFCEATRRGYRDTAMFEGEGVTFQLPPKVQEKGTVSDVLAELTRDEHFTVVDVLGLAGDATGNGEARLEGATSVVLRCAAIGAWKEALEDSNIKLDFALKLIRNDHGGDASRTVSITRSFAHEYSFPKALLGNRSIVNILAHYVAQTSEFPELTEYARKESLGGQVLRTRTMAIAMPVMKFTLKRYVEEARKVNEGRPGYIYGLTLSGWLRLFLGMLDALIAMWQYGIAHRDLKPGNVMIDDQGRAIVIDFGGATCILDPDTATPFPFGSPDSAACGNSAYGDPWVYTCRNSAYPTGWKKPTMLDGVYRSSDLYAVGLMMIQYLAGGERDAEPTSIPLHPDCPPALVGLLRMICQPLPTHRPTAHQAYRFVACIAYGPKPADVTNVAQAGDWLTKERLRTMLEGKAPHEHPLDFEYKTLYLAISTPESLLEDVTYIKTRSATK